MEIWRSSDRNKNAVFLRHDVNAAAESATPTSQWRSSKYGSILLSLRDMTMRRKTDGQQINDGQTPSHRIAYLAVDGPAMITLQHNLIIGRFNHCIIIPLSLRRSTTLTIPTTVPEKTSSSSRTGIWLKTDAIWNWLKAAIKIKSIHLCSNYGVAHQTPDVKYSKYYQI